jgi:hypothetical protein
MNNISKARIEELKTIAEKHNGVLKPETVVKFAENPKTALHSAFDWDDTVAAKKWRIEQARGIIQVCVEIITVKNKDMSVRVFIAPISDRKEAGVGGYKLMTDLLRNKSGRREILETALSELDAFRKKYNWLSELVKVFEALDETRKLLK